jgi:hypothetical protein
MLPLVGRGRDAVCPPRLTAKRMKSFFAAYGSSCSCMLWVACVRTSSPLFAVSTSCEVGKATCSSCGSRGGSQGPNTWDRRKLGSVCMQQIVQTAKARTDGTSGDEADARQGQQDVQLLFGLRRPAASRRGTMSCLLHTSVSFSDLTAFCYRVHQVRRISRTATG